MEKYYEKTENYWNERYLRDGKIWGKVPSKTAKYALKLFQKMKIKKILIPGSGYGRNTKLFSMKGFHVTGIEISKEAYNIAKIFDLKTTFIHGSVLEIPFYNDKFDAIYCFNVLHLFRKEESKQFIEICYNKIKNSGFVFFVVFSEKESSFGKGRMVEDNTYESKPGRPVHYFSKEDLSKYFNKFTIIETGFMEEQENHGEIGQHTHRLRFIFAQKKR